MQSYGKYNIEIVSLMLQRTGTFHDVYNRSFTMNIDADSMEDLRRRISSTGGEAAITGRAFRGMSSGILVPRTEVDGRRDRIVVPDGWNSPRCRFMMEVNVTSNLGDDSKYFFQGFTDHMGLSNMGNIDPNMKFYINGFIRVQEIERRTRRGLERFGVVKESAQVIDGSLVYDNHTSTHKMRAVDLYSNIQERMYAESFEGGVEDSRTTLRSHRDSLFAKRQDNLASEYFSETLDAFRRSRDAVQFGMGQAGVIERSQQTLSADIHNMQSNPVLLQLGRIQGEVNSTSFTINDLLDLDPDARRSGVIVGAELSRAAISQLATHHSDVSDWRASTTEAIWATQIANGVAAIMMKNFHRSLDMSIDNMNMMQEIILDLQDARAVADNMPIEITENMLSDIKDLFYDISRSGQDDFAIQIRSNLYDQTEVMISVHNEPEQRFFVPSFADSLMSPFYTRNKDDLSNLSTDLESILDEIGQDITESTSLTDVGSSRL